MTAAEQAMQDLRNAIRAEMIEEMKTWWAEFGHDYDYEGAATDMIEDLTNTLERL